ncbi:MAG TPA: MBL fold metallo-hydrolase [Armatimonadota bacterium]|jgi:cyclase
MTFETDTILKLAPGVWMLNAVDNCLWADLGEGVLVVDALEDLSMCPLIPEDILATAGKPMKWVVNTHGDSDHVACNAGWAAGGATILAHEEVARKLAGRPGCPSVTFTDRYTLEGDRQDAHLRWLGGAHSPGDTIVYLPHARILCIGDLFSWGLIPFPAFDTGRAARLVEVLNSILEYDADTIVCGHGPVLTPEHIRRWLNYFEELRHTVSALAEKGLSLEAILAECPPPDDMRGWWRFTEWKHNQNISVLLGEKGKRE